MISRGTEVSASEEQRPAGPERIPDCFRPGAQAGFTLLELLVAVTITVVMAGLMFAVTGNVLNLWQRSQGQQEQNATAHQVFALLERDLQSALRRRDANCWLAADILDSAAALANHGWLLNTGRAKPAAGGSLRLVPIDASSGLPSLRDARFGLSGVWLRWVGTNVESGGGLPTVIAWQLVRRPVTGDAVGSNPAPARYALYRSVVSASETFSQGYDVTASAYGSTGNTPTSALSTAFRQARNVTNPSHANLLAPNVVDFGCWCYRRDAAGELVRLFPTDGSDVSHHAIGQSDSDPSRFPEVVDVFLRILTGEGVILVEAMEAGLSTRPSEFTTDAEWWWSVVETHSAVFTRRIEILGKGP
ncbi:MAG: hypothetical protein RL091_1883 [Verrucomicrobiota bacterium]